jgi:membrane-associated phospholipid phosphatase
MALSSIRLDEEKYWEFNFIIAPVAILILAASVRYALGREVGGIGKTVLELGGVLRDWFPFLLFLLTYEAFQSRVWTTVSSRRFDEELLSLDRRLFGETPTVLVQRWMGPFLTDIFTAAYFLHLVLPPVLALVLYRRDRRLFREFLLSIVLAGALGFIGYLTVPAVGPGTAFPTLFQKDLSGALYRPVTELLDAARAPRDAFPSLHVGISTIVLFFGWRRGRGWLIALTPLVVANWISTIALRYHYLVDVIAGWIVAAAAIVLARWLIGLESRIRERVSSGFPMPDHPVTE